MFNDEFLKEIFSNDEMHKIPIGCQSTAIHVFEELLEQKVRTNKYATISELLSNYESVPTD